MDLDNELDFIKFTWRKEEATVEWPHIALFDHADEAVRASAKRTSFLTSPLGAPADGLIWIPIVNDPHTLCTYWRCPEMDYSAPNLYNMWINATRSHFRGNILGDTPGKDRNYNLYFKTMGGDSMKVPLILLEVAAVKLTLRQLGINNIE